MQKTPHQQMVTDLVKPGADILKTLTPAKCNLLHMAMGISGEYLEISQGLLGLHEKLTSGEVDGNGVPDRTNIIEELGDAVFFLEGLAQELELNVEALKASQDIAARTGPVTLLNSVEIIQDTIKKHVIYDKPLTSADEVSLASGIGLTQLSIEGLAESLDISMEDVIEANMQKLLKGDTARYKTGTYSDDQAQDRADKSS